ncbi:transposase [Streptomyces sp. NPDC006739]|uniref:transposase n=1 Tax=Streptomyces sp. NPDC006739 TaxID=3364763 RepID=UPI003696A275
MIHDSGDRKDGTGMAHGGRQWPARLGKTDNGIVTVTAGSTDGRVYWPLHASSCTPAHPFARGRWYSASRTNLYPAVRTKPQPAAFLAARGKEAGSGCRAVVADCAYSGATTGTAPTVPSAATRHQPSPATVWWRAWTDADPPSELQALIDAVTTGHGLHLYLRIQ